LEKFPLGFAINWCFNKWQTDNTARLTTPCTCAKKQGHGKSTSKSTTTKT